jgi:catechol 2,3-dioxygenase-like lactoylglutathione lyase family enzyme
MPAALVAVAFDADDPARLASFWAAVLGRRIVDELSGALLPGDETQVGLRFTSAATERSGQNRLHLHLTSSTLEHQRRTVETVLALGGRHLDIGQRPEEDHVVMSDPGGNEFCVIGPGNNFLAGCGFLGEVTCDGTRDVGLFWRDALVWPLVWDQNEQTAVQSPRGGTKLSWDTWPKPTPTEARPDGPPLALEHATNRQRFDLIAPDLAAEVERLVTLGATEVADRHTSVELADPDGNQFTMSPA